MNFAAALDKREHGFLAAVAATHCALTGVLIAFLAADECFVRLNSFAFAAHRSRLNFAHGFANAVRHEPCGFVSDAETAMQLVRAHPFL